MSDAPRTEPQEAADERPPGVREHVEGMPDAPDLPPVPEDADDTRGWHLRRLLRKPLTLGLGGALVVAALIAGTAIVNPLVGLAAAAGAVLVVLVIVWAIASGRAEDDFFRAYAEGRSLRWTGTKTSLPASTPLLRKGDRRYAKERFDGVLPGGLEGSLCLYTYEVETRDSDGDKQTSYYHFTLGLAELPETVEFISELYCQRRSGFRFMDSMEDVFRKRQRVEHESEAVDKAYEIFIGEHDDLNRARQLLSPSFLVWLDGHSPQGFAFELVNGSLVTNVKGHKKSAAELDAFCEATAALARRLHEEATELSGGRGA